jgi:hypothetical protein
VGLDKPETTTLALACNDVNLKKMGARGGQLGALSLKKKRFF